MNDRAHRGGGRVSVDAVTYVLRHSEERLGNRIVLIVLADFANPDGGNIFASVKVIAERARMSERAAQYALRSLESSGSIRPTGRHKSGTTIYEIPGVQILHRVQNHAQNVSDFAPEPSLNIENLRVQILHCPDPNCGLSFKSELRLVEHRRNVHGEEIALPDQEAA